MRSIVVGDIHGCIDEFRELLDKCAFTSNDRLILAGDLVDRGPDSAGVLRLARELGAVGVLGNHDEKALRWHRHEERKKLNPKYKNPMKEMSPERIAEHLSFTDEDWVYLENLPPWLRVDERSVVVHAGVMPGIPIEQQTPNHCYRLRYIRKSVMKMAQANHVKETPEDCVFWTELWDNRHDLVFYGHQVVPEWNRPGGKMYHVVKSAAGGMSIGLDAGGCFGGSLTAAVVDPSSSMSFVSVKARREYRPLQPWVDDA